MPLLLCRSREPTTDVPVSPLIPQSMAFPTAVSSVCYPQVKWLPTTPEIPKRKRRDHPSPVYQIYAPNTAVPSSSLPPVVYSFYCIFPVDIR